MHTDTRTDCERIERALIFTDWARGIDHFDKPEKYRRKQWRRQSRRRTRDVLHAVYRGRRSADCTD